MKTSIAIFGIFSLLSAFLFFTNKKEVSANANSSYSTSTSKSVKVAKRISKDFTTDDLSVMPLYQKEYRFLEIQNQDLKGLPSDYFDGAENMVNGLYLQDNHFRTIPTTIQSLTGLIGLNMSNNLLTKVPDDFFKSFNNLENLNFSNNNLRSQFKLTSYSNLSSLDLAYNKITHLFIGEKQHIRNLNLNKNEITSFPINLRRLSGLQNLNLANNQIADLDNLYDPKKEYLAKEYLLNDLISLNLTSNRISSLPKSLDRAPYLEELMLDGNSILGKVELKGYHYLKEFNIIDQKVEEVLISGANNLEKIELKENRIQKFNITNRVETLKSINLTNNKLTTIPDGLKNAPNLTILALGHNDIQDISNLKNYLQIEELYLDHNLLTKVPYISKEGRGELISLILNYNQIKVLDLNKIDKSLIKLYLQHNDIQRIISTKKDIQLEELNLFDNPNLTSISVKVLSSMPKLMTLNITNTGITGKNLKEIETYCERNGVNLVLE